MAVASACRAARDDLIELQYEDLEDDVPTKSFFPLDRLRSYLTESTPLTTGKIEEILRCICNQCRSDATLFKNPDPVDYVHRITGRGSTSEEPTISAYGLFGLLIYVGHPLLIIGFLNKGCNDFYLEGSASRPFDFSRENLKWYTEGFNERDSSGFRRFASEFAKAVPEFAIPHMNSGDYSVYHERAVLPFVEEREIGRKLDSKGRWTSEGANGKVFAFKIYPEYRRFPHAKRVKEYARKRIETPELVAYLEKENLQNARRYRDDHIVKLIKAYRLGETMNLIFPLAKTNLDHLLRDPVLEYSKERGGPLERCNAWRQMLGVAKAVRKIQGLDPSATSADTTTVPDRLCIHFDLKPDNILVEDDGTWVVTDFGQAALTYPKFGGTPRVTNHFGTDGYAPPEIENIKLECGRKYDIWSLGCILLEVTAFVVLGYAGLVGSNKPGNGFRGLDQARRAASPRSRNVDERFFYRLPPEGTYVLKREIGAFIEFLQTTVDAGLENSDRSKAFLAKVIHLIRRMLDPDAETRIDIVGVVRELSNAIEQALPDTAINGTPEMVPAEHESIIGGPELNSICLWHWSGRIKDWEATCLEAFENDAGNMRLHCWLQNRQPVDINFRRDYVKIIPLYAFWEQSQSPSGPWIQFLFFSHTYPSEVSNTQFSFSGTTPGAALADARMVQSKLTSQHITGSFALQSVKLKRYVPLTGKIWNNALRKLGSTRAEEKAGEMTPTLQLGSATIQLWVEQVDAAAESRRKRRSSSSHAIDGVRDLRLEPHYQSGYREIPPRRVAIYLHWHKFVCTIKMDVNWAIRKDQSKDCVLYFEPSKPGRDPHFVASWVRPTQEELNEEIPAGLPLDPATLQYFEDLDRFEADRFELCFMTPHNRDQFWDKYMEVKKNWDHLRRELEKSQGFTPVNRRPDHYPHPDFPNAGFVPRPKRKARFSIPNQPTTRATEVPEAMSAPNMDKGKARAVEPPDGHHGQVPGLPESNGLLIVPIEPTLPRPPPSGARSPGPNSLSSDEKMPYKGGYGRGKSSGPKKLG